MAFFLIGPWLAAVAAEPPLNFQNTYDCNDPAISPDVASKQLCEQYASVVKPKAWTDAEKTKLLGLWADYAKKIPDFISVVQSHGPVKVYRFTVGATWDKQTQLLVPYAFNGEAMTDTNALMLTDQAFTEDKALNSYMGHTPLQHVFLHELTHLFDADQTPGLLSESSTFLQLTNFTMGTTSDGQTYTSGPNLPGLNLDQLSAENTQMRTLLSQGKFLESAKLTHEVGMKFGYSSSYAMTNPIECLAENTSWTYYSPVPPTYLSAAMLGFLKDNVFR